MKQSDLDAIIKGLPDAGTYPYDLYYCPLLLCNGEIVFEKKSIFITPFGKFVIWTLKGL